MTQYEDRVAYPFLLSRQFLDEAVVMGGPKLLWRLLAEDDSGKVVRLRVAGPAPLDVNTPEDFEQLTLESTWPDRYPPDI